MKTCPFCAEEIQDAAIKCKHCGEFLDGSRPSRMEKHPIPWYSRTTFIVIAVLCVGPFAIPLIWLRPKTTPAWKIGLTLGILALSWVLMLATMKSVSTLREYYNLMYSL